ncbi:MAG: T9SS type A sorting domain-containing protein [Bacteroidales bacterium]|nr:T9SS type A sorting domain-containing protein [Bacteroidales bacterium]
MKRKPHIFALLLLCAASLPLPRVMAQEILVPLGTVAHGRAEASKSKAQKKLQLPFFDDFSNYEGNPDNARWEMGHAVVNKDFGPLPPTVGVVTLDACQATGALHVGAASSLFGGDTLQSLPLRMDSLFAPQPAALSISDSIYLSFYYLPGGGYGDMWARIGDAPETQDSLILEFFSVPDSAWQKAWATGGISVDTLLARTGSAWQWVAIPVKDEKYLCNGFRFRFRNLCSLEPQPKVGMVANCDQWNLDYIYLDKSRNRRDSIVRDVAFVEKAPSMLRTYQAIPARQFIPSEMATSINMVITNRYGEPLSLHYSYRVLDPNGTEVTAYDGGTDNIAPYAQGHVYQTASAHAHPPVDFSYPVTGAPATFTVEHVVREGYGGDPFPQNDTLRFTQVFNNYYAYDDGMPENGYGLTSTSSRLDMATRFVLNVPDTLTALDLWFNSTRGGENIGIGFNICVWNNKDGMPSTLLHKDAGLQRVETESLDRFRRYRLAQPVILAADTYYIGFEQNSKNFINVGFDRSGLQQGQNFYRTSSVWQQSILSGATLLRPCFGASALVGIPAATRQRVCVYPNPASDRLHVRLEGADAAARIELLNTQGRMERRTRGTAPGLYLIDLTGLPAGIYVLQVTQGGSRTIQKIVKQ